MERTEGWPAILQLLKLWLARRAPDKTLADVTGRSSELVDYLSEQVFAGLPHSLQGFLLRTSIADRICAPLADALTGSDDGAEMLQLLQRLNFFIVPLDDNHIWFRYHPLLREFLINLAQERNEDVDGLHKAAAVWFAE